MITRDERERFERKLRTTDTRKFPRHQRANYSEKLELELTLRFKLRPAGWPGNDTMTIARVVFTVLGFIKYTLLGDEGVQAATVRWRRGDESRWRKPGDIL